MAVLRYDDVLAAVRADHLKAMVTLWGGKISMRKDACVEWILQALANPDRVRAAVASLDPYERAALSFVKQAGGVIDYELLGLGLLAMGLPMPPRFLQSHSDISDEIARALIKHGVVLSSHSHDPGYLPSRFGGDVTVFADERMLAAVEPTVEPAPFAIKAARPPSTFTYRPPPAAVLDIVGFLKAIDYLGGLGLTQKGVPRADDLRKLRRAVQWPDDVLIVDGFRFEDAFNGLLSALRNSGWLAQSHYEIALAKPVQEIAALDYSELIAAVFNGFLRSSGDAYGRSEQQGRFALSIALRSLPRAEKAYFTFDAFDQAVFARIGEHFALQYKLQRPYTFRKSAAEVRQLEEEWRRGLRAAWLGRERIWLERILTGWLYFLGLVEIGLDQHAPVSFRLTELGQTVLHPQSAASPKSMPAKDGGHLQTPPATWVVQPNFDIVVYLDRTTSTQLAFLERHAERISAQQYIAQYRLTRESVYWGLEDGSSIAELLTELRAGAHADLPQNIVVELREWAALRERITLYRRGQLLEFSKPEARDAALGAGRQGKPVGDRYFLLRAGQAADLHTDVRGSATIVNYAAGLPKCLTASEDGVLTVQNGYTDLLIESQLDQWAERVSHQQWRLTAERVAAGVRAGSRLDELFALLTMRLRKAIPPLLALALRNWAGKAIAVEIATVSILRCLQPEAIAAIKTSTRLKPYILGELSPDTLLVDTAQLAAFRDQLARAGLKIETHVGLDG